MNLSFKPELLKKVLSGEKTVTRRGWPTKYREGQIVTITPGMGRIGCGKVRILGVTEANLSFDTAEANREGFPDWAAFIGYWEQINKPKKFNPTMRVARIEFELVEVTRTVCPCCGGVGTEPVE